MKKGSRFTSEQLVKITLANRKRMLANPPNKGKKFSEKWRRNLSESHKGKHLSEEGKKKVRDFQRSLGEKHHLYKHGLTKNKAYRDSQKRGWLKRRKLADGFYSEEDWENLKARYNWTCPCCQKREPEIKLTVDHIIPLSSGGSNNIENLQPLCRSCNCRKHTKTIRY